MLLVETGVGVVDEQFLKLFKNYSYMKKFDVFCNLLG